MIEPPMRGAELLNCEALQNYELSVNPRENGPHLPSPKHSQWAIGPPAQYNVHWADLARSTPIELMATSAKATPVKARRTTSRKPSPAVAAKRAPQPHAPALDDPSLFINRELSLLDFQRRVLEEAQDPTNPPLDRVMFLSFVGSNLDEFFMVRVAGLKRQIEKGVTESGPDAMTPAEQLRGIRASVMRLNRAAYECWSRELVPTLSKAGLRIVNYPDLTEEQRAVADAYFQDTIFPTLTPLAFDPGRPFPHISNLSLNLAVVLRDAEKVEHFARVKIPDTLPQLIPVTVAPKLKSRTKVVVKEQVFVWIEQLVTASLGALFPGMEIVEAHPFHVTRDADSAIQDLEAGDLMESVEEGVWQRRFADVVRVEINEAMSASVLEILVTNLELDRDDIYKITGPLSLVRVRSLAKFDRPDLKFPTFVPALPAPLLKDEDEDIFATIRRGDVLFHHPFDSFQPIVGLIQKAANDPNVLAIKITLYRVGRNAPVVDALLAAAENGKQVAVVLELKARFDEESNIGWARKLEEYGVHVVYGLLGLKVHCKAALIVRKEGDVIRRYAHLSTGNYNSVTAQLYTDVGMLTCDPDIGAEVSDNIKVTSIVGRFLEHSRIFYFCNGGDEEIYLGSADLMPRNLNRRVEVLFPVEDKGLVRVLKDDILGTYLKEQAKARHMQPDGKYVRDANAGKKNALNSQEIFIARAIKRSGN